MTEALRMSGVSHGYRQGATEVTALSDVTLSVARGIRRRITGWYTLFVVGASAVTGTLVGALTVVASWPGLSTAGTIDRSLVLPLPELAVIGLAVPLVVTLVAMVLPVGREGRPTAD